MDLFPVEKMKLVARQAAARMGVEKTPQQWRAFFRKLVRDYRLASARDGECLNRYTDEEVWRMIVELCRRKP